MIILAENGKVFCGEAMELSARARGVQLHLIQSDKPNKNTYTESFDGPFRDGSLKEDWFPLLLHTRTAIETWRRE